jgi:ferredoxin/flavodoxin---NADP+ reductase
LHGNPSLFMDSGLSGYIRNLKLQRRYLSKIERLTDDAFVLTIEEKYDFLPGQVLAISIDRSISPRLYSICSGNQENQLEILFNIKAGGMLTPALSKLKPGDELLVSNPFGSFLGDNQPAWWIAAGTGIAPYRSMIRSGLGKHNMLIHGSRTTDGFFFESEFMSLFGDHYVRCCSQETKDGVYPGRLTQWLRGQHLIPPALRYYLCGSAEMVVEVRDILISRGVGIENIMSEIYF